MQLPPPSTQPPPVPSMDTESMRSGRSGRSDARSQRSHASSRPRKSGGRHQRDRIFDKYRQQKEQGQLQDDNMTDRDDRSVTISMAPSSVHSYPANPMNHRPLPPAVQMVNGPNGQERIEVQIMEQDDNWGDNTTAITGATSEMGFSIDDMHMVSKETETSIGFSCARYIGSFLAGILGLIAFASPVVMVALPKLGIQEWELSECGPECEGLFMSFTAKLLILLIGSWALFFRRPKATMPRIFVLRALILFLIFIITFAFWLFYGVRIYETAEKNYHSIVLYAASLVDALLFIHYLGVILIEIRQLQPQYAVHMVRSPDGESRNYTAGQLSIQRLAVWCLEQYYRDFPVYNPYLDHLSARPRKPNAAGFKFYDVDGNPTANNANNRARALFSAAARRRDAGHNDRFYEEQDYERRVRKRKARLLTACEESFTHIKRLQEESGPAIPMDPMEAAQAIFPSMARALQKYLRITRQQPRYTMENILQHLAVVISHDLSPKAFLDRYLTQGPVVWNDKEWRSTQTWVLVCDQLISQSCGDGTLLQLRQGDVSIMVTVRRLPHFNLTEEVIDPKRNKFVLRLNSETSV